MKRITRTFCSKLISASLAVIMALSLALSALPGIVTDYEGETVKAEETKVKSYSLPITIRDLHEEYMLYGLSETVSHRPMHVGDLYSSIREVEQNNLTYRVPNYAEANNYEHVKYLTTNFLNYACITDTTLDESHSQYFTQDFRAKLRQIISKNNISEAAWDTTTVNTKGKALDDVRTANEAAVWLLDHLFIDGSFTLEGKTVEFSKTYPKYERLILDKRSTNVNGDEIECYGYNSCTVDKKEALTVFDTKNKEIRNGEDGIFQADLGWFPLDKEIVGDDDFADLTFGYEAGEELGHNYFTSTYGNGQFIYHAKDDLFFEFYGDDDVLLYINNRLAFDGGKLQNGALYSVWLEDTDENGVTVAQHLGLEEGKVYNFDFYQMERCHRQSAFTIHTNINISNPSAMPVKNAYDSDGNKLDDKSTVPQNEDLTYEFVLFNNSASGMQGVINLTFEDALLDVVLTKDNLDFGSFTTIDDIVVKAPGMSDYEEVSESQLKDLLAKGLQPGESIAIKGFNYNSGPKARIIDNTVYTTATGKAMNSDADYIIRGSDDMLLYVPADLVVTKDVNGEFGDYTKKFDFTLVVKDTNDQVYTGPLEVEGQNNLTAQNGRYNFSLADSESINITIPYGYTYEVSEADYEDDGYKTTVKHIADTSAVSPVEVTAANPCAGTSVTNAAITFVNTDIEPVTVPLNIEKELLKGNESAALEANKFSFKLTPIEGTPGTEQIVGNKADGAIEFDSLVFDAVGTYKYEVSEVIDANKDKNIKYDETHHFVEIEIGTNEDKSAFEVEKIYLDNAEWNTDNALTFTNKVKTPDTVKIEATKQFDGDLKEKTFEFVLKDTDDGTEYKAYSDENGAIAFEELTFDAVGEYNFTLSEVAVETDDTIIYDTVVYDITVTVDTPNNSDENLYATVDYKKVNDTVSSLEFVNTLRKPATVPFNVSKSLEGNIPKAGEFRFKLVKVNDDGTSEALQERTTNENGIVTFDSLSFSECGEYHYTISEVKGVDGDIIYDKTVYDMVVNVTAPKTSVSYEADVAYTVNGETVTDISFTNETREHVFFALDAMKTMDGKAPEAGKFEFTLADYENPGEIIDKAVNDADGKVQFKELEYEAAGTYKYLISEVLGEDETVVYDPVTYIATVTVSVPDDDGKYLASVEYNKADAPSEETNESITATFANTTRDSAVVELTASKSLDGKAPKKGQFEFELADDDGNVLQTVENDADGLITFEALDFNKSGIYNYTITEVDTEDKDIIYDESVYEVQIKVTADIESPDAFQAEIQITKDDSSVSAINFENETVKKAVNAKTGDGATPVIWGLTSLLSLLVIAMLVMLKRRKFF